MNTLEIVWPYFFFFFLVTDERSVNCGLKSLLSFDLGDAEVSRRKHIRWYSLIYPNQEKQRRKKGKILFCLLFSFSARPGPGRAERPTCPKAAKRQHHLYISFYGLIRFPDLEKKGLFQCRSLEIQAPGTRHAVYSNTLKGLGPLTWGLVPLFHYLFSVFSCSHRPLMAWNSFVTLDLW